MQPNPIVQGERFNRWTLVKEAPSVTYAYAKRNVIRRQVVARCDCGNEKVVDLKSIKIGQSKSCGCIRAEVASETHRDKGIGDLTGARMGLLYYTEEAGYKKGNRFIQCNCSCGNKHILSVNQFMRGKTLSCGCLKRERGKAKKKFGGSG